METKSLITLGAMFREMNTWIPCTKWFNEADASGITTKNSSRFRDAVDYWIRGQYDEDPGLLVDELINILMEGR